VTLSENVAHQASLPSVLTNSAWSICWINERDVFLNLNNPGYIIEPCGICRVCRCISKCLLIEACLFRFNEDSWIISSHFNTRYRSSQSVSFLLLSRGQRQCLLVSSVGGTSVQWRPILCSFWPDVPTPCGWCWITRRFSKTLLR